jgi:hypothetical protein
LIASEPTIAAVLAKVRGLDVTGEISAVDLRVRPETS